MLRESAVFARLIVCSELTDLVSFYHQAPVAQEVIPVNRPSDAPLVIKQSEALLLSRKRGELIVGLVGTGDKEFLAVEDGRSEEGEGKTSRSTSVGDGRIIGAMSRVDELARNAALPETARTCRRLHLVMLRNAFITSG